MDGFTAFKYYLAVKLHFTNPQFDIKQNKGRLKAGRDSFQGRNDKFLFEKLAHQFKSDQQYIRYIAANFMYGHHDVIYNPTVARVNFTEYMRRRESITNIFQNDLATMSHERAMYAHGHIEFGWSRHSIPDVVKLYLKGQITLETLVILDSIDGWVEKIRKELNSPVLLMINDILFNIERAQMFVKFDKDKVKRVYDKFHNDVITRADSAHG
mgnify:CR=1 FL=1